MQDEVKVSQADREAAANWFFEPTEAEVCEPFCRAIREGRDDGNTLVQAFAKFEQSIRHQAERETLARMEPVAFTALVGTRRERRRIESVNELMRLINGGSFISEIRRVSTLPPAPEAGQ